VEGELNYLEAGLESIREALRGPNEPIEKIVIQS
jgi:hypothetical protein